MALLSPFHYASISRGTRLQRARRQAQMMMLGIGICFGLFATELILRVFWEPVVTLSFETRGPHPDYGFAPLSGASGRIVRPEYDVAFQHTRQRMRGFYPRSAERDAETRARLLFLGDSLVYGAGCEEADSFVSRVARALPDVEVINSGCPGYGQREELAVLDKLGGAMKPEITVLVFYWNDLEDNLRAEPAYAVNAARQVRRVNPPQTATDPLWWWPVEQTAPRSKWKTCYLLEFVRESTGASRHRFAGLTRPQRITTPAAMQNAWDLLDEQLRLIKLRADELGTHLIVVHIPDYNLVNPKAVIPTIKPLNLEVGAGLRKICARHGIDQYDALETLQTAFQTRGATATRSGPLYYEIDRHLAPEGHRVIANYLLTLLDPLLSPAAD